MSPQKAVDIFLRSLEECSDMQPAPTLPASEQIVCQGLARNRTLEATPKERK